MMGIPYMGSKRRIAPDLIQFMASKNPEARHFYDLFGGGGAMSFAALQSGHFESVHYNELNSAVVALLEKILTDGVTDELYQWVGRERFFELIKGDDWQAGLAQTCWSFGNDQRTYLYGRKVEPAKRFAHKEVMAAGGSCKRIEVLKSLKQSGEFPSQHVSRLEHLERIRHLERLQQHELNKLQITNQDYTSVIITTPPESTIIYCDIPYQGTKEYKFNDFNHDKFFEWYLNSPYKIYVSSYVAQLPCVFEIRHRTKQSATVNNKVTERLFCNQ